MICACLCQSTVHFTCSLHPVLPAQTLICPLYVLICPLYVPYMSLICPLYVPYMSSLRKRSRQEDQPSNWTLDHGIKRDLLYQKRPTQSKETYSVKRDLLSQKRPTLGGHPASWTGHSELPKSETADTTARTTICGLFMSLVSTDHSHNDVVEVMLRVIDAGDARKVDQCEGA
jgi:hypothetical protein